MKLSRLIKLTVGAVVTFLLVAPFGAFFPALGQYNPAALIGIATVATLQGSNYINYPYLYLIGYSGFMDGGQGFIAYDSSDTTTADNSCTVFVDTGGHRFKRQKTGLVNVQWGGAKATNTHTQNNTAFSNCITAARDQSTNSSPLAAIYVPISTQAYPASSIALGDVSYIADPGAKLDCVSATAACVSYTGSSATGHVIRNLNITNSATTSAAGIVGLAIDDTIGSLSIENLTVYLQATNTGSKCVTLKGSFNIHFSGLTYIRNCNGGLLVGLVDDNNFGVNLITIDQILAVLDDGFLPGASGAGTSNALIRICEGNGWDIRSGDILSGVDSTVPATRPVGIDIGNCTLDASDPPSFGHKIRAQFEGNFTNLIQSGNGVYAGSAQQPKDIAFDDLVITASGITGNVFDLQKTDGIRISMGLWPTLGGGQYRVSTDANTTNLTIIDDHYLGAAYNINATTTTSTTIIGNGVVYVGSNRGLQFPNNSDAAGSSTLATSNAPGNTSCTPVWVQLTIAGVNYALPACPVP